MTLHDSSKMVTVLATLLLCTACASGSGTIDPNAQSDGSDAEEKAAVQGAEEKSRLLSIRNNILAALRTAARKLTTTTAPETTEVSTNTGGTTVPGPTTSPSVGAVAGAGSIMAAGNEPTNPILFATQVPVHTGFAARTTAFANHGASMLQVPRGGDLMIRYPDGTLRNLTKEAGFGMDGLQGANAIAVRDPSVHWDGTKAVFSMVVGAPSSRFMVQNYYWQIYEVSGLGRNEQTRITKVAGQPANFNNISPIYGTNDEILFTSDSPASGERHLYPQLDEYESSATVTGIWSLNRATGVSRRLNHTISGAFNPTIDSFGRVIFTRWDHLQRDQQADLQRQAVNPTDYGAFNFSNESATASRVGLLEETFPESRLGQQSRYGPVNGHTSNTFMPWQMNEDGTDELSVNHVGRHEFFFSFMPPSFANDRNLQEFSSASFRANQLTLRLDAGVFEIKEDPFRPGNYLAINSREFGPHTASAIVEFNGPPGLSPEKMAIKAVTAQEERATNIVPGGRYRSPLPLSNGVLVASHSPYGAASLQVGQDWNFRLKVLQKASTGLYEPKSNLTSGIVKNVTWWDPDNQRSFNGELWELDAVEVRVRPKPTRRAAPNFESPERLVMAEEQVNEAELRSWLASRNLALMITRNNTSRDRADVQQPFNLVVPGGVQSISPKGGTVYEISHFQFFQADMLRGYRGEGRRALATPSAVVAQSNPQNAGPSGSVKIALDGSAAAFVPAGKALTWQTTDPSGEGIVRERNWITFQPGEVRTCAGCHAINDRDQLDRPTPTNKPEALRALLRYWKANK